jgi:hypothetical protein
VGWERETSVCDNCCAETDNEPQVLCDECMGEDRLADLRAARDEAAVKACEAIRDVRGAQCPFCGMSYGHAGREMAAYNNARDALREAEEGT